MNISRDFPIFLGVPPIISGMGKTTDFKFCTHIHKVNQNKRHENFWKNSRWHSHGVPKILRAPIYGAHCAVIFEIAQLSCCICNKMIFKDAQHCKRLAVRLLLKCQFLNFLNTLFHKVMYTERLSVVGSVIHC